MKKLFSLTAIFLCIAILCSCGAPEAQTPVERAAAGAHALLGAGGGLLADTDIVRAGSSSFDWLAIALHRAGAEEKYDDYLAAVERYVTDCYAASGTLSDYKATEYHRIALTVLELGGDPTAFGTKSDGTPVDLIAEGTYNFAGDLYAQGLNSPVYALLTLDAGGFDKAVLQRVEAAVAPDAAVARKRAVHPAACAVAVDVLAPREGETQRQHVAVVQPPF